MRYGAIVGVFACMLLGGLSVGALDASAYREPLVHEGSPEEEWLEVKAISEGQIEGACGVAVSPAFGSLYVSDYYHRTVDQFSAGGMFAGSLILPGGDPPLVEINQYNAVCGLGVDAGGNLYANEFHQRVLRLLPSEAVIDPGYSTGIAVDEAGDVYVNHRTYISVYDAPVEPGEEPAEKIGLGSLGDAYGLAVDSKAGRVYVPDAADETVKVYEPTVKLADPVATIDGPSGTGFNSLTDASLAVDMSETEGEGHLLVVDNLKPLFERPQAAIYEFASNGKFLDRLQTRTTGPPGEMKNDAPIFGEPSGIAVDPKSGTLYVTTGNSERSNVLAYGPFAPFAPPTFGVGSSPQVSTAGSAAGASQSEGPTAKRSAKRHQASASEVVQRSGIRVAFDAKLTPRKLPRSGAAPVRFALSAKIASTDGSIPPQLQGIAIEINRNGHLNPAGLPVCGAARIQPSTTAGALRACGSSLVGEGHFSAKVLLAQQAPFPSSGKIVAFNGSWQGHPAILAHVYGTEPVPTSYTLPFVIGSAGKGPYGATLSASLPGFTSKWGYVTGISLDLGRSFRYRGHQRSYLSAGCPAPKGFPGATFPLARASLAFADHEPVDQTLTRSCGAR